LIQAAQRPHSASRDPSARGRGSEPKPYTDGTEELEIFLAQVASLWEVEASNYPTDLKKIHKVAGLLRGKAANWWRTYRLAIDEKAAIRATGQYEFKPRYAEWEFFEDSLRDAFGGRHDTARYQQELETLKHRTGHIDEYLNEFTRLMWLIGPFSENTLKNWLKKGLDGSLGRRWSEISDRPATLAAQIKRLREMGHQSEDYALTQRAIRGSETVKDKTTTPGGKTKEKSHGEKSSTGGVSSKPDKEKSGRRDKKPGGTTETKRPKPGDSEWKDKETELKGVSSELRKKRWEAGQCQKCGKEGHKFWTCRSPKPVTEDKKVAGAKRKRDESDNRETKKVAATRTDYHLVESPGYVIGEVDSEGDTPMFVE